MHARMVLARQDGTLRRSKYFRGCAARLTNCCVLLMQRPFLGHTPSRVAATASRSLAAVRFA